jgi:hypothetical protein
MSLRFSKKYHTTFRRFSSGCELNFIFSVKDVKKFCENANVNPTTKFAIARNGCAMVAISLFVSFVYVIQDLSNPKAFKSKTLFY